MGGPARLKRLIVVVAASAAMCLGEGCHTGKVSPRFLMPGERRLDSPPADLAGQWWGLCDDNRLRPVTPKQVRTREPCAGKDVVILSVEECAAWLLTRGAPWARDRTVLSGEFHRSEPNRGEIIFLKHKWLIEERPRARAGFRGGFEIVVSAGSKRQVLFSTDSSDDGGWGGVPWVGDIDNDGLPDILLGVSLKYSVACRQLFLSSRALPGQLLAGVAGLCDTSC
jgi:hypothetical protein